MLQPSATHSSFSPARRLGQVEEYYFSRKLREIARMRADGHDILNLGIGSPDLPPHPAVIRTLQQAAADPAAHSYQSYSGLPELRRGFAGWYRDHLQTSLDPDSEILPLMGSKEGIMHISMAFLDPGDEVLVPDPGYPTYRAAAELAGASVRTYPLRESEGWLPDLEALAAEGLERVRLMWVNYPHMPTGTAASARLFGRLIDFARRHRILLVNDNPYAFILNEQPLSLLSVAGATDVAMELNSLSKAHNMAGWRIGMLAGSAEHLATVLRFKSNMDSGMFLPVQQAAVTALQLPQSWYRELNATYRDRRRQAEQILQLLGCRFDATQTGLFLWGRIPEETEDGFILSDEVLYGAGVFITPGGIFGEQGRAYIRISLCSPASRLEAALTRIQQLKAQ